MKDLSILTLNKKGIKDFALERNKLLKTAKTKWVLFVDSDEVVSRDLEKEITEAVKDDSYQGFYVIRRDYMFGSELKHGEFSKYGWFGNTKLIRLGKKNSGKWKRPVHELWNIIGKVGTLKNPLLHYPHRDLKSFIVNINHFSTLHANALNKEGKKSSLIKIIVWPPGKFVYNFIFRLGFLDGMEGFVVAIMMSFHSFISWTKLYFLQH